MHCTMFSAVPAHVSSLAQPWIPYLQEDKVPLPLRILKECPRDHRSDPGPDRWRSCKYSESDIPRAPWGHHDGQGGHGVGHQYASSDPGESSYGNEGVVCRAEGICYGEDDNGGAPHQH